MKIPEISYYWGTGSYVKVPKRRFWSRCRSNFINRLTTKLSVLFWFLFWRIKFDIANSSAYSMIKTGTCRIRFRNLYELTLLLQKNDVEVVVGSLLVQN